VKRLVRVVVVAVNGIDRKSIHAG